ncbi:putative membrane protein [Morganella morganii]|nr:putative membrane protein [Morganella morganii]
MPPVFPLVFFTFQNVLRDCFYFLHLSVILILHFCVITGINCGQ